MEQVIQKIKVFFAYLLAPLEGNDGKLSIRRLLAVGFFYGMVRYVEKSYGLERPIDSEVLWTFGLLICIMCGIVTADKVLEKIPSLKT